MESDPNFESIIGEYRDNRNKAVTRRRGERGGALMSEASRNPERGLTPFPALSQLGSDPNLTFEKEQAACSMQQAAPYAVLPRCICRSTCANRSTATVSRVARDTMMPVANDSGIVNSAGFLSGNQAPECFRMST